MGPVVSGSGERFPLMDSVRAIAALCIVVYHATAQFSIAPGTRDIQMTLVVGVAIFFVISGFLLYRPFAVAQLQGRPAPDAGAFAWRRVLRIVPAYFVALTAYLVLGSGDAQADDLPFLYLFGEVYSADHIFAGLGVAWSLDCEIVFYVMLPLLAVAVAAHRPDEPADRLRRQLVLLATMVTASVLFKVWALTWASPGAGDDAVVFFQPAWHLDVFLAGMALAVVSAQAQVSGRAPRAWTWLAAHGDLAWVGALAAVGAVATLRATTTGTASFVAVHELSIVVAVLTVVPAVVGGQVGVVRTRVLAARPLLHLGVISYGIYLWHLQIFSRAADLPGPTVVGLALGLAGAYVAALASWRLVEAPAMRLRHLVRQDRTPVPATVRAAP